MKLSCDSPVPWTPNPNDVLRHPIGGSDGGDGERYHPPFWGSPAPRGWRRIGSVSSFWGRDLDCSTEISGPYPGAPKSTNRFSRCRYLDCAADAACRKQRSTLKLVGASIADHAAPITLSGWLAISGSPVSCHSIPGDRCRRVFRRWHPSHRRAATGLR